MRYFPKSDQEIHCMLRAINKGSLDELFSSIPESARLKDLLSLPKRLDELGIKRELAFAQAGPRTVSFLGAGATEHFVPEWVSQQLLRAEWYTSYTPYQPEASQGTLQAIFEFQSMVASLFGLPVANASMYDGATALVEALLMALRITGKKCVALSNTIHPEYRACVKTYFGAAGLEVIDLDYDKTGQTSQDALERVFRTSASTIGAVAFQSPNFFGRLEAARELTELTHAHNALVVQGVTDMSALAIITSPGAVGVDIAIGEGLGLLGGINLGGPGVGLLACRRQYLRQLPGRLVGLTTDSEGNPGYVLTLSTREQHIRREKATSNICTNHNLMALAFAMTLSAYGKSGFIELAKTNLKKTLYLRSCLKPPGVAISWPGPHYNETVVHVGEQLNTRMRIAEQMGIYAGLNLTRFYPECQGQLLVSCTEMHADADIQQLAEILSGAHDDKA